MKGLWLEEENFYVSPYSTLHRSHVERLARHVHLQNHPSCAGECCKTWAQWLLEMENDYVTLLKLCLLVIN